MIPPNWVFSVLLALGGICAFGVLSLKLLELILGELITQLGTKVKPLKSSDELIQGIREWQSVKTAKLWLLAFAALFTVAGMLVRLLLGRSF